MLERPTILIPVAVAAIAVVLIGPRFFQSEQPTTDFIYAWKTVSSVTSAPSVSGEKKFEGGYVVTEGNEFQMIPGESEVRVYVHHVVPNTSVPIAIEEIGTYPVISGTTDPTGFTFVELPAGFFKKNTQTEYGLVKGINKKVLSLNVPRGPGYEVLFLGWIK
jgi:hypothetical protein